MITWLGLGNTLSALLNHPKQLDLLRSDLGKHAQPAVWERLLWQPAVGMLQGMSRSDHLARDRNPCFDADDLRDHAAHRDPAVYDRPDEFDITRDVMPTVPFGQGPHSCIGNWLANAELVAALTALIQRLPI